MRFRKMDDGQIVPSNAAVPSWTTPGGRDVYERSAPRSQFTDAPYLGHFWGEDFWRLADATEPGGAFECSPNA